MKKSAIPQYIWFISLVVISITLAILINQMESKASNVASQIDINSINAEIKIHRDYLGGLWLEELKFKIPGDKEEIIKSMKLVCFDDKKGPLVINITEINPNFIEKDINGYYTLTKPIHLAGPDDSTVFYYTFDDCINGGNITKDYSGNNNHGIIYGKPSCVKGVEGYALMLGTFGYVKSKLSSMINNKTLSYCGWFLFKDLFNDWSYLYVEGLPPYQRFFSLSFIKYLLSIKIDIIGKGNYYVHINPPINKWYFICQVVDTVNGKIEFWKDGKLFLSESISKGDIPGKPTNIWIAGTPEKYQHLIGIIDDAILFNKVLKPYEIRTMYYYNCTKPGARWFLYVGNIEDGVKLAETTVD